MDNYVIYLRKSRADVDAENHSEEDTLARHERILMELARKQQLNITEIYREIVSGETIAARPVMQRLLREVEQGIWRGVLVVEVERLARGDTIDQGIIAQTLKYSDTKIITPSKTYDPNDEFDEEYFEFGLFMSRREYKAINRRQQAGRLASVKEGKYVGTEPPYGYRRKKLDGDKGFTLEEILEEADIIRLIYELYTHGEQQPNGTFKRLGLSRICQKLNMLNAKPKKADRWNADSIHHILKNPVYNGYIRWKYRPDKKMLKDGIVTITRPRTSPDEHIIVKGLHKPIIADDIWKLTQDYLKENQVHPVPSKLEVKNPLSGLIVCGKCGHHMTRKFGKGRKDTLACRYTGCGNISSTLALVEEQIINALEQWLNDYKVHIETNTHINNFQVEVAQKAIKKLDGELKTIVTQKSKIQDLLEQGIYSTDDYIERSRLLTERLNRIKEDKDTLENEIALNTTKEPTYKQLLPRVKKIIAIYHDSPTAKAKNDLLKEVLQHVLYTKNINMKLSKNPYSFELELFPKLPK